MKQTFILKAPKSATRINERYILDVYQPYLYATEDDFIIVQFNSKKEMREAFADIAKPCGETFYIDDKTRATYVKVMAQGRKTAKEFAFLASMITPYNEY